MLAWATCSLTTCAPRPFAPPPTVVTEDFAGVRADVGVLYWEYYIQF